MNFNEAETAELADFYNQEKIRIQAQLRHVEKILRKISGRNMDSSGVILTKQGFKAKKRGPKSVWGKFILEQLAICNRPMSYKELMEIAMKLHGGGNSNYQSIRASILNSAFRLRSIQGKVATVHQEGKKEKFIVLIQWLDDKGMLPKEQQNWLKKEIEFFPKRGRSFRDSCSQVCRRLRTAIGNFLYRNCGYPQTKKGLEAFFFGMKNHPFTEIQC